MKVLFVFIALMFGVAGCACAEPTIVVTKTEKVGDQRRYTYTVTGWSQSDKTVSSCGWATVREGCYTTLWVVYTDGGESMGGEIVRQWTQEASDHLATTGAVLYGLNNRGEFLIPYTDTTTITTHFRAGLSACLQVMIGIDRLMRPLTSCAPAKPTPVTCNITGDTTIDHKTLSDNAVDGALAATKLYIRCEKPTSLTVNATRTNVRGVKLRYDDSLYSAIKVNGQDATDGIKIQNNAWITITSTLKANGDIEPGPFLGSTVITVSFD